jgi:integrase
MVAAQVPGGRQGKAPAKRAEALNNFEAVALAWLDHRGGAWAERTHAASKASLENDVFPTFGKRAVEIFKPRKTAHRAAMAEREAPTFLHRLDAYEGDPSTKGALTLLMLTAVRPGELRGARWDEIDVERARRSTGDMSRPTASPRCAGA